MNRKRDFMNAYAEKPELVKQAERKVLEQKLLGKVSLVTGGARGLGRSYVLRLARLGADVVVNDIDLEAYKEYDENISAPTVMDEVRNFGRRSLGIQADATKKAEVDTMFKRILDEFGKLDILICNAGGALRRPGVPRDAPWEGLTDFLHQFNINFLGTLLCCEAAATSMKKQRSGKIVTVASQAGIHATVPRSAESDDAGFRGAYGTAKAAVIHYTRTLAARLGRYNVNVNCMAPAWILSSRAIGGGRNKQETRKYLESQIALGRLGWPEDCAKVVEFLVTDLSDYVTGQVISVCGGYILF
ncbi:MAG: SDR family oxidoreductase [Candidatus Bathyarchaeota archaeon]|nr:SDR family oxidoreductase [Candidatus Bathyarchaeota archaeon]